MRQTLALAIALALGGCRGGGQPELADQNLTPLVVLGSVPDAGAPGVIALGSTLQITFSHDLDPATYAAGVALTLRRQAVAVTLSGPFPGAPGWPEYSALDPSNFVLSVSQASGGAACLPDGGTLGCLASTAGVPYYQLTLTSALQDLTGQPLTTPLQLSFATP